MQIAIPLLVLLAVLIIVGGFVALGAARLQRQRRRDVHETPTDTLRFPVPRGQDAAAIVTALKREGFSSMMEMVPTGQDIVVSCRSTRDRDRERIRAIVGATPTSLEGGTANGTGIRFRDEGGGMHGA